MTDRIEIRGGADEFEAAVIAVVVDHARAEESVRAGQSPDRDNRLPAWVRAIDPARYPERHRPHPIA